MPPNCVGFRVARWCCIRDTTSWSMYAMRNCSMPRLRSRKHSTSSTRVGITTFSIGTARPICSSSRLFSRPSGGIANRRSQRTSSKFSLFDALPCRQYDRGDSEAWEGQADQESRAMVAVVQSDLGAMPLGNGFDDSQAQAAARHVCALTTIEAIKHACPLGRRNPRSRVEHLDLNGVWRARDLHVHRPTLWRVAYGVLQEIIEQDAQTVHIAHEAGRVITCEPQINPFLGCERHMVSDDRVQEG